METSFCTICWNRSYVTTIWKAIYHCLFGKNRLNGVEYRWTSPPPPFPEMKVICTRFICALINYQQRCVVCWSFPKCTKMKNAMLNCHLSTTLVHFLRLKCINIKSYATISNLFCLLNSNLCPFFLLFVPPYYYTNPRKNLSCGAIRLFPKATIFLSEHFTFLKILQLRFER